MTARVLDEGFGISGRQLRHGPVAAGQGRPGLGAASPIAIAMDAPVASAPTAQLGLFVSLISFRPH